VIEGKTMFKDEDQDMVAGAETSQSRPTSATPRPRMDEESDMDDTDLLGAATLAKIGGKADEVVEVAKVEEVAKVAEVEAVEEPKTASDLPETEKED
ncbi:MAG: hypothetical protein Q8R09_04545, partial [Anaerolineaceae bacterium]|nr:hypothetical protein [Anaerolineaceae bacterium]